MEPWWTFGGYGPAIVSGIVEAGVIAGAIIWEARHQSGRERRLERPYIFLEVMANTFQSTIDGALHRRVQGTAHVEFLFRNHGKTPAVVRRLQYELNHYNPRPEQLDYSFAQPLPAGELVIPPSAVSRTYKMLDLAPVTPQNANSFASGSPPWFFWFYGEIEYGDVFGASHVTRFFWMYNHLTATFEPSSVAGPKLNTRS
jgi:hypothetical protein